MKSSLVLLIVSLGIERYTQGFAPSSFSTAKSSNNNVLVTPLSSSNSPEEELDFQWDLFQKHHAKGSWKGIWTTYDYIGDVLDERVASVNYYNKDADKSVFEQTHSIVTGAKRSDCATCFDSMEVKEIPVAVYDRSNAEKGKPVFSKTRLGANAMVNGPSLLRSGVMATELILAWGDGRVRVTFQHAPVWEAGVEPGSVPPQGLKLVRTMVSREALRDTAPTAETEAANPPTPGNPVFYRPVPPFNWHKKWAGTSWTWGPQTGDRGWAIDDLEEEDAWQGIATVERWNLRLPGGIFMQAPRVITDMQAELCRLAWLPDDETMLRVEAGCLALQPMVMDDDQLVGFYPPSLASLRCDVLKKMGELENVPSFVKDQSGSEADELMKPHAESITQTEQEKTTTVPEAKKESTDKTSASTSKTDKKTSVSTASKNNDKDSGLDAIRDALSL